MNPPRAPSLPQDTSTKASGAWMVVTDLHQPAPVHLEGAFSPLFYAYGAILLEVMLRLFAISVLVWLPVIAFGDGVREPASWVAAVSAALYEPSLYMIAVAREAPGLAKARALGFLVRPLFLTNVLQGYLFWTFGFLATLTFRLAAYLVWHVVYGAWLSPRRLARAPREPASPPPQLSRSGTSARRKRVARRARAALIALPQHDQLALQRLRFSVAQRQDRPGRPQRGGGLSRKLFGEIEPSPVACQARPEHARLIDADPEHERVWIGQTVDRPREPSGQRLLALHLVLRAARTRSPDQPVLQEQTDGRVVVPASTSAALRTNVDSDGAEAGFARLRKLRRYFRNTTPAENWSAAERREIFGGYGAEGIRTPDLLAASQTLFQLSYGPGTPKCSFEERRFRPRRLRPSRTAHPTRDPRAGSTAARPA